MKIVIYFISIIFIVGCASKEGHNPEINHSIKIKYDHHRLLTTLYLSYNEKVLDSVILHNILFGEDSLLTIKENVWYYSYLKRCGSDCHSSNQIILTTKNNQLKIMMAIRKRFSEDVNDLYYEKDTSLKPQDVLEYNHYVSWYKISSDFIDNPLIKEYLFKGKEYDSGKGDLYSYPLKFEKTEEIYYNGKTLLKGSFNIVDSYNEKTNKQINQTVYKLKFKESEFIYFEGRWYEVGLKNYLLQFL